MMPVSTYRPLLLALVAMVGVGLATACKSVPPAKEAPAPQAPAFQPSTKPAEKVDETAGFNATAPTGDTLGEVPSTKADKLNAQGVLKRIQFDFDKADLRQDATQILTDDAARIRENGGLAVRIEGHCDERGTVEYNLALGDRRARAARDFLVSAGIPSQRLRTISYGKERPLDPGHNESAWAMNRRAELVFVAE
jgi:peptidoglycan-associated lipoprotein